MTSSVTLNPGYFSRRSLADWGFALLAYGASSAARDTLTAYRGAEWTLR